MAKIRIKNTKQLEKILANKMANELYFSSNLQDATAEVMQEVIEYNVYGAFTPTEYERRGDNGGFSDTGNMRFTDIDVQGGKTIFTFENITKGADSMSGEYIAETLETGIKDNWDNPNAKDSQGRVVSTERNFIDETINDLNASKGKLADALRKDLRSLGFKIKG